MARETNLARTLRVGREKLAAEVGEPCLIEDSESGEVNLPFPYPPRESETR